MPFTSAGLANGGVSAHYQVQYDDSLSATDGLEPAKHLHGFCEQDFGWMTFWFNGVDFAYDLPIPVQITGGGPGGDWVIDTTDSTSVTLKLKDGDPFDMARYILVAEVSEMFMISQDLGWAEPQGFLSPGDEGSTGEGLSRFLSAEFLKANSLLGGIPPVTFQVGSLWLNSARHNWIDNNPDDVQPDDVTGCTTLFIYFLHYQLGFDIPSIIAAAATNLPGVFQNLTGKTDAAGEFLDLVKLHYPPTTTYSPVGDNIFPVSNLSEFWAPNAITCGYPDDGTCRIFIDKPALADLPIQLKSDDPAHVQVGPQVTIKLGDVSALIPLQTTAIAGPFSPISVNVHATYAGKTLTAAVDVLPPRLTGLSLSPDTVVCGNSSSGVVTVDRASLNGDIVVDLICGTPGYASVQSQVTIKQGDLSSSPFPITTPNIAIPFPTAHAELFASYSGYWVSASLTVEPQVVAGIIQSLTLFPTTVTGGLQAIGVVTLQQAVPTDTKVGLAALVAGALPFGGGSSPAASVPPWITILAGGTMGVFHVKTAHLPAPPNHRTVTIIATAVIEKYAKLTVTE